MNQRIGKKSITIMLENKGKGLLTSNLRTILLMEADFNFNNNILERDLMQCAERGGVAPKEKYSIRKGKKPLCTLSKNDYFTT